MPFAVFGSGYASAALLQALRDTPVQALVRLRDGPGHRQDHPEG